LAIKSNKPDRFEQLLALGAVGMFVAVVIALVRGYRHWHAVPNLVWLHLLTIMIALVLTPVMLMRPRGTRQHRQIGWVWMLAMFFSAAESLFVRVTQPGHFSPIHLLSILVMVAVPRAIWAAKTHRTAAHRATIRGIVLGSLLIAGFFTFPFGRLLGTWLFS